MNEDKSSPTTDEEAKEMLSACGSTLFRDVSLVLYKHYRSYDNDVAEAYIRTIEQMDIIANTKGLGVITAPGRDLADLADWLQKDWTVKLPPELLTKRGEVPWYHHDTDVNFMYQGDIQAVDISGTTPASSVDSSLYSPDFLGMWTDMENRMSGGAFQHKEWGDGSLKAMIEKHAAERKLYKEAEGHKPITHESLMDASGRLDGLMGLSANITPDQVPVSEEVRDLVAKCRATDVDIADIYSGFHTPHEEPRRFPDMWSGSSLPDLCKAREMTDEVAEHTRARFKFFTQWRTTKQSLESLHSVLSAANASLPPYADWIKAVAPGLDFDALFATHFPNITAAVTEKLPVPTFSTITSSSSYFIGCESLYDYSSPATNPHLKGNVWVSQDDEEPGDAGIVDYD